MDLPRLLRMTVALPLAIAGAALAQASSPPKASGAEKATAPRTAATMPSDVIRVTLPKDAAALLGAGAREGRMLLFLSREGAPFTDGPPIEAPVFQNPQPMYSLPVAALDPGGSVGFGADAVSFPVPIDELDGTFRVQACFDRDRLERGHLAPGNLVSEIVTVQLHRDAKDTAEVVLSAAIPAPERAQLPNLRWFEMRSERLSRALGRDVTMRAGVALPPGWEDPNFRRRLFPAVYVIPGFGGRFLRAESYARTLATPGTQAVMPQAVWIVLDPEAPLGHHGFVDSPANGPWGTALVEEFIPALERNFRLIPRAEARLVTGHSSGGWSSLWLELQHPDVFGACFSSSPDPVDFHRFQTSDLYADASVFTDAEGHERPSFRVPVAGTFEKVLMTAREEAGMERVLGPARDSGEQWDTWSAMWSDVDPATRLPRPMFDAVTGAIDRGVIRNAWSRYDIAALVRADPGRYLPIFREKVRLLCGARDNFFLERGVEGLQAALRDAADALARTGQMLPEGPGYVEIVPGEDHRSMGAAANLRWNREARDYLHQRKLD